jgi:hypothetical protein
MEEETEKTFDIVKAVKQLFAHNPTTLNPQNIKNLDKY